MRDYRTRAQLRASGEWERRGLDKETGEIVPLRGNPQAIPLWKVQGSTPPAKLRGRRTWIQPPLVRKKAVAL